jgi:predicted transcriptional regulator
MSQSDRERMQVLWAEGLASGPSRFDNIAAIKAEARRRLTLEALADVDQGRVVDHQAVYDWAASLKPEGPRPLTPYKKSRK